MKIVKFVSAGRAVFCFHPRFVGVSCCPFDGHRDWVFLEAGGGHAETKAGDKVIMWYISVNRDDEAITMPHDIIIDRKNLRHHISFGFGIHRCVGNRLAEMQFRIVWEEIPKRGLDSKIEVVGEPERVASNFVHDYLALPVRIGA